MPTPDEILDDHVRPVRELAARLRCLICEPVPEAEEAARPGWHAITYRHPEAGYFAGIFPEADRVVIVFEHGHALSDPYGLLETGTRKQVRTVTLHPSGRVPSAKLRRLLRSAVAYDLSRQASS